MVDPESKAYYAHVPRHDVSIPEAPKLEDGFFVNAAARLDSTADRLQSVGDRLDDLVARLTGVPPTEEDGIDSADRIGGHLQYLSNRLDAIAPKAHRIEKIVATLEEIL